MTRRPPMPPDGNIRRAHQRMAPGGRLWSESPVKGPAVRVVAAGDDPDTPPPPADPTVDVWEVDIAAPAVGDSTVNMSALGFLAPGQVGAFAAFGPSVGWSAPPGWTVLASGSVGLLDYMVAFRVFTGSDSVTVGTSLAPGWGPTATGAGLGRMTIMSFTDVEGTMAVTVGPPAADATAIALQPPLASMAGVWQTVGGTADPQQGGDPATWVPDLGGTYADMGTRSQSDPPARAFTGTVFPQRPPETANVELGGDVFDGIALTMGFVT